MLNPKTIRLSERNCAMKILNFLKRRDRRLNDCVTDLVFVHIAQHYHNGY